MPVLLELEAAYLKAKKDRRFQAEFEHDLKHSIGRPTPLYFAEQLTKKLGGAKIYLEREALCHTGAHKINNSIGQTLLAKRMNKPCVIAETEAGHHGVAVATVDAMFGLRCEIDMGTEDMQRETFPYWVQSWARIPTHADPRFSGCDRAGDAKTNPSRRESLPDYLVAGVGSGSNAIGLFHAFVWRRQGQDGWCRSRRVRPRERKACGPLFWRPGVLHGTTTYLLQDADTPMRRMEKRWRRSTCWRTILLPKSCQRKGSRLCWGNTQAMTRLDATFRRLRAKGKKALIACVMAGNPSLAETERLVLEWERNGGDIIELSVPSSDPIADGPAIQQAAEWPRAAARRCARSWMR